MDNSSEVKTPPFCLSDFEIPTVPAIVEKILRITVDPSWKIKDVVRVVSTDAALTAKVLQVANSPFFSRGHGTTVSTLLQGIVRIGYDALKNILIGFAIKQKFQKADFVERCLWEHFAATAFSSYHVANVTGRGLADVAFTAGLLHDIGKVVFKNADRKYEKMLEKIFLDGGSIDDCYAYEEKVFGLTHCELGVKVMKEWGFSEELLIPVRFHHPHAAQSLDFKIHGWLPAVVGLGNLIAHELLLNRRKPEELGELTESFYNEALKLSVEDLVALGEQSLETYKNEKAFIEIRK